jgi:hypothetical protein
MPVAGFLFLAAVDSTKRCVTDFGWGQRRGLLKICLGAGNCA